MKIIEALKELPLINKKIESNKQQISQYAALASNKEKPFGSNEKQREKVASLIQANEDLANNFEIITNNLAYTNTVLKINIDGVEKTIREWIVFKNVTAPMRISTFQCLDTAHEQRNSKVTAEDLTEGFKVERMYDEEKKLMAIAAVSDLVGKVDAALEIVNVTNDIVDPEQEL